MLKPMVLGLGALSIGISSVFMMKQDIDVSPQTNPVIQATAQAVPSLQQIMTHDADIAKAVEKNALAEFKAADPSELKLPVDEWVNDFSGQAEPQVAWVVDAENPIIEEGGIHVAHVQMNPGVLEQLSLGQTLVLNLPHLNESVQAEITSTHNTQDGVEVWQGQIENGQVYENVSISRGNRQTYITVATGSGVYSVKVDNQTGLATIIDDGEITSRKSQGNTDTIKPKPLQIVPPQLTI
ncbi:hypothetical protein H0A36_01635 [Endozoicomonas sp. SM1973]|uniref:Uncharacterized protein n=1 Tax=Spartinivicinus marinus TaxID=2994442 RepID=A0A853HWA2_9GAMM|nr:hypothetical protein [Spartinivicinus marinus]MCX4030066.1 hypothetical protein [Spartinivicinus marinus]NYZ64689.1 hypothetical protein [Spartinivicinus marinus]